MALHTLSRTPYLTISYDTMNSWLYADWQGEIDLTTVRMGNQSMLKALKALPCRKLLNDDTNVRQILDMQDWYLDDMVRPLAQAGLRYIAWILSPNFRYDNTLITTIQLEQQPMTMCFDDLTAAYEWLQDCEEIFVYPPAAPDLPLRA